MRLAEHVAHTVNVDAMLDAMSHQQFDEWCAKDRIEPIGSEATRHILALIGVTVATAAGAKHASVEMFMPWLEQVTHEQTAAQMQAIMATVPGAVTYG